MPNNSQVRWKISTPSAAQPRRPSSAPTRAGVGERAAVVVMRGPGDFWGGRDDPDVLPRQLRSLAVEPAPPRPMRAAMDRHGTAGLEIWASGLRLGSERRDAAGTIAVDT